MATMSDNTSLAVRLTRIAGDFAALGSVANTAHVKDALGLAELIGEAVEELAELTTLRAENESLRERVKRIGAQASLNQMDADLGYLNQQREGWESERPVIWDAGLDEGYARAVSDEACSERKPRPNPHILSPLSTESTS